MRVFVLALFAALSASACASSGHATTARLPFCVAVIPVTCRAEPASAGTTSVQLSIDATHLSSVLADELRKKCFTEVTLLAPPPAPAGDDPGTPSLEQLDAYWVQAAQRAGADLILECELWVQPGVKQDRNEKFWLNLPLFLLGGPMCYLVDDRTYHAHAGLHGRILDLNPIAAGRADLQDGLSQLVDVSSRFEESSLDFIDRTTNSPSAYAASLLVPPGLLASDTEDAKKSLVRYAERTLVQRFATALAEQSAACLTAESVASFYLAPDFALVRSGEHVVVKGDVILRRDQVDRLDSWRLTIGEREFSGDFDEGEPDAAASTLRHEYRRFQIDVSVAPESLARTARLEIVEGGASPATRTFTLPIGDGDQGATSRTTLLAMPARS